MMILSTEDKLRVALEALRAIAKFDHVPECYSSAPVHECGCYDQDEQEIAKDALAQIDAEGPRPHDYEDRLTAKTNLGNFGGRRR